MLLKLSRENYLPAFRQGFKRHSVEAFPHEKQKNKLKVGFSNVVFHLNYTG